jgi:dihydroxyacetone kinase
MGVSFSAGTSPAVGKPSFELGENEMELGLGIHGEPGAQKTLLQPADPLVETLLMSILHRGFGDAKRVAVMLNNLGATTEMELAIVARHAAPFLESKGFKVERIYAGTFLSSLDMAGISISVLAVDDERLRLLDAATSAPAWPNAAKQSPGKRPAPVAAVPAAAPLQGAQNESLRRAIEAACRALLQAEANLTELDRVTGDGDLGVSMARGAHAVLAALPAYPLNDIPATLKAIGNTLRRELGGSSGPLYGVLFLRCARVLEATQQWPQAISQGCQAITSLGGATPGDRTMLDALYPFADALPRGIDSALAAAEQGAHATAQMTPRLGRSSYLGQRVVGYPDPGAVAVTIWLRAVCAVISKQSDH